MATARISALAALLVKRGPIRSHTLTVTALDPGVTLDRLEIDFAGSSRAYGPIPETRIRK